MKRETADPAIAGRQFAPNERTRFADFGDSIRNHLEDANPVILSPADNALSTL